MANIKQIKGVYCVGEAYEGQNYYVKCEDEADDFIACTIEETCWTGVINELERLCPDLEILEVEAC